jgi:hypothetical protein
LQFSHLQIGVYIKINLVFETQGCRTWGKTRMSLSLLWSWVWNNQLRAFLLLIAAGFGTMFFVNSFDLFLSFAQPLEAHCDGKDFFDCVDALATAHKITPMVQILIAAGLVALAFVGREIFIALLVILTGMIWLLGGFELWHYFFSDPPSKLFEFFREFFGNGWRVPAALLCATWVIGTVFIVRFWHLLFAYVCQTWAAQKEHRIEWDLLPSQQNTLNNLQNLMSERAIAANTYEGRVVALKGGWGGGKTTILNYLQQQQHQYPHVVFCNINAWSIQSAPDLELAVLKQIIGNYRVISWLGWRTLPIGKIFILPVIKNLKLSLPWLSGKVDLEQQESRPIPIEWRYLVARIGIALQSRGRHLVICLEDVDRCSYQATQSFLSLTQRFLNVPNVTVILPYVEKQLRHKAFDPLQIVEEDLQASSTAVLTSMIDVAAADLPQNPRETPTKRRFERLQLEFLNMEPAEQEYYFSEVERRYVGVSSVVVGNLTARDLVQIVCNKSHDPEDHPHNLQLTDFRDQEQVWIDGSLQGQLGSKSKDRTDLGLENISTRQFASAAERMFVDQLTVAGLVNFSNTQVSSNAAGKIDVPIGSNFANALTKFALSTTLYFS